MSMQINRADASGVMAFYADSELAADDFALLASQALRSLGHLGQHHEVTLVDDGGTLKGAVNIQDVVSTIKPSKHLGKAGAVREGLLAALKSNPTTQYFIQSDFDGDPNPQQARKLLRTLLQNAISGDQLAMVLGERDEALKKEGFLDRHREVVFALQKKFCILLGYPQVVDPTTGLRVYTRGLAEIFVKHGVSEGFGSDVEQLVLAKLFDAKVFPVKLDRARKRISHTAIYKFIACKDALMLHADSLKRKGFIELVEVFSNLDPSKMISFKMQKKTFTLAPSAGVMRGVKS